MTRQPGTVAYLGAAAALTGAWPVVSEPGRHLIFLLASVLAAIPVAGLVRRTPAGERHPFVLLALATGWLIAGNTVMLAGGNPAAAAGDLILAVSSLHMLAAAVCLVLRRGRDDIGGLLDAGVVAVVIAALTWTTLLEPSLDRAGVPLPAKVGLLTTVLLISGVLGALIRVRHTGERRSVPLALFTGAVVAYLAGAVAVIGVTGTISAPSTVLRETMFLIGYVLLGLAALHPDAPALARPGPVPPERAFVARVVMLTGAAAVIPGVTAVREILGIRGDAALLTVGNLLIVALIGIRVARIGRQREHAERLLRHQATHDLLTGLPNRAELWHRLDAALAREQRTGQPAVILLFCDLNGFKQVNDRLGHLAGDQLLTEVAARLRTGLPDSATVARYGGDEFVLLGEDPAQEAAAQRLIAHVRAALAVPVRIAGEPVTVGSSIGAVHSDGRLDADELIRRADHAMYQEKALRHAA